MLWLMEARRLGKTFIRAWREHRGLSLRRLQDRLEVEPGGDPLVSFASLQRIETGNQPYSQPILEALAEALDCTPADLISTDPQQADGDLLAALRSLDDERKRQALDYITYLRNLKTA